MQTFTPFFCGFYFVSVMVTCVILKVLSTIDRWQTSWPVVCVCVPFEPKAPIFFSLKLELFCLFWNFRGPTETVEKMLWFFEQIT